MKRLFTKGLHINEGMNYHKMTIFLLITLLSVCTGCHAEEPAINAAAESISEAEISALNPGMPTASMDKTALEDCPPDETAGHENVDEEPSGSFTVTYQGQKSDNNIELRHCDCVYDADGIQVYAEYLYWLMVPESFPYNQYVLYIQTPQEQVQLYPVKDFLVDKEQGILYMKMAGEDGFESVKSISFLGKNGHILDSQREIFNDIQAEKMLCDAYGMKEDCFSNVTVELTGVESGNPGILRGETGGVNKADGQRYYADWEIDLSDGGQKVTPCLLKQYDPDKDKEALTECNRFFDQIEQGDWSCVKPMEEMQYLWEYSEAEWLRMDVNGDGMPELLNGFVIDEKLIISCIFAYREGMAELVYVDVNDGMEYLFVAGNGSLIYEWGVSGGPHTKVIRLCRFDLKWHKEYLDTLVRYEFPAEEGEAFGEYYREHYPDTYGVGGEGVYYLRERRKTEEELGKNEDGKYTVREYLTEEQFLKAYEEMTGWDFRSKIF